MAEAAPIGLTVFDPFMDPDNVESRWKYWLARFENYLLAMNITAIDRKKALLLYYGGENIFQIQDKISKSDDNYNELVRKLNEHFKQKKKSKNEAKTTEVEDTLCGKCGRSQHKSKEDCPAKGKQCVKCQGYNHFANVCRMKKSVQNENLSKAESKNEAKTTEAEDTLCGKCGRSQHKSKEDCPAKGKQCVKCQGYNHFANVCRMKKSVQGENTSQAVCAKCKKCGKLHDEISVCPAKGKTCNKCKKLDHFDYMCKSEDKEDKVTVPKITHTHVKITHVQHITQTGVQLNSFGNKPKTKQTNDPANEKKSSNKSDEPNGKANSKPKKNAESTEKEGDAKSIEPSGKAKSKPKKNAATIEKEVDEIVDIKKWPTVSD